LYENFQNDDARNKTISLLSSDESIMSKNELLAYIQRQNILDLIHPDVKTLFKLIQDQDDVFSLAKKGEELLVKLEGNPAFKTFISPIRNVIIYKLLGRLAKIYKTLKIERFIQLIGALDFNSCANIIHLCHNTEFIDVKIDHQRKLIVFSDPRQDLHNISMGITNLSEEVKEISALIDEQRENTVYLKNLEHFREDAKSFLENASQELKRRFELIGNMKNIKEIKPVNVVPQTATDSSIKKEAAATFKAKEETKRKADIKHQATKKLDELALNKKANLWKELQQYKGIKIKGRKLEDIALEDVDSIKLEEWEKARENHLRGEKEHEEKQNKKLFNKYDYLERARRREQAVVIEKLAEEAKAEKQQLLDQDKANFEKKQEIKKKLLLALPLKQAKATSVLAERKKKSEEDYEEYKIRIESKCKPLLLTQSQDYLKEALEKAIAAAEQQAKEAKLREEAKGSMLRQSFLKGGDRDRDPSDSVGFSRSTLTREAMQATQATDTRSKAEAPAPNQPIVRGVTKPQPTTQPATDDSGKKKQDIGFIQRSEKKRDEEVKQPEPKKETPAPVKPSFTRGPEISRNVEAPKKEVAREIKPEPKAEPKPDNKFAKSGGPPSRFTNAKKEVDKPVAAPRNEEKKIEESPKKS